ncbi:related to microfibril-associated protein [Sporisorium scitamineum]|uniref:Related to microfibril-associated protein n=1 Tax=Sporisorium scitamineum TaxID=49012 RepID=A0A127Z8N5_9BASI|nr:related to microfibril-associated protein [Sporisorium scitamineum]
MALPAPQKQASRVARPAARYRPGKAPLGAGASLDDYSDSDASDGHEEHDKDAGPVGVTDPSSGTAALINGAAHQQRRTAGIILNDLGSGTKKLDLRLNHTSQPASGEQDDDSSEYGTDTDEEPSKPVFRKPGTSASATQPPAAASDSSEYETDSEEESDDEPAPQPMLKPLFVPKRARTTIPTSAADAQQPTEADSKAKAEAEAAQRRKEAHDLAAATIKRSLAEKGHTESLKTDVDDTDGLDPSAEFEAWRQRELARLQRDREAILSKRAEQQELETFRSLPEAEKERLGRERAAQLRAEKLEQRGNPAFLQKYYHKGSFFQDMDILKRDYTEKTTKDVDVSKLPKMMQVRNYGVKGRSKWTHLANEDTSKAAMKVDVGGASGDKGCSRCGGAHLRRDCPGVAGGEGASGANRAELLGKGERSRTWGMDADEDKGESSHTRRRSKSPRRDPSRYDCDESSTHSRSSHRYDDDRRPHHDSRSSQDDRDRPKHSSSSHRDKDRNHRHHRDSDHDRPHHHSENHNHSRSDPHRSDDSREKHKRRDRDHHHHHYHRSSDRSKTNRNHESDRKRSRLDL